MGKRLPPRVSLRGLIAAGPQSADSGMFDRESAAEPAPTATTADQAELGESLSEIREHARQRQQEQADLGDASPLTGDDADFLRDIGA